VITDDASLLLLEVERVLGDPSSWPLAVEFPNSLALCAINSVYSLQGTSAAGRNVMRRYRSHREQLGADPDYDDGTDLLRTIEQIGGPQEFATQITNSTKLGNTGRLKSEGLFEGVNRIVDCGLNTIGDLKQGIAEDFVLWSREWRKTKGLGPASWDYLIMNAGIDDIKVDTMIRRFFERAIGDPSTSPSDQRIKTAFFEVANQLGTSLRQLDHAVWNYESPHSRYK